MTAGVVVIAVGNRSRGDDAIGPLLLGRLEAWLGGDGRGTDVDTIEDFQLQIEHALDLAGRHLALFIDAGMGTHAPYELRTVEAAAPGSSHTSHALTPESVLGVYRQVTGENPPPAFLLCVRGERFGLGVDLSNEARANVDAAWRRLRSLCARPEVAYWRAAAGNAVAGTAAIPAVADVSATP